MKTRKGTKVDHKRAGAAPKREPRRAVATVGHTVDDRVEVTIKVGDEKGTAETVRLGRIVALDQVAVLLEGELEPRAFAPSAVRRPGTGKVRP